jgi:hypothetical protein
LKICSLLGAELEEPKRKNSESEIFNVARQQVLKDPSSVKNLPNRLASLFWHQPSFNASMEFERKKSLIGTQGNQIFSPMITDFWR